MPTAPTLKNPFYIEGPMLPEATRRVVRSAEEWAALPTIFKQVSRPPPSVDFPQEMVLVASAGSIACTGPRMIVGALREDGEALVATAHRFESPLGDVGWGDSTPGDAVVVAGDPRPVRWEEREHRYGVPFPFPTSRNRTLALTHLICHPATSPAEPFHTVVRTERDFEELAGRSPFPWQMFTRDDIRLAEGPDRQMLLAAGTGRQPTSEYECLILDVRSDDDAGEVVVEVHSYEPYWPRPAADGTPQPTTPTDIVLVPYDPRPVRWEAFHHLR